MNVGKLNRRITIQQRTEGLDSYGQPNQSWIDVATVWANIKPIKGRELLIAQSMRSEVTHNIDIRYRTGITAAMRVNYNGRFFNIQAVIDENERHQTLALQCTEGTNDG